MKEIWEIVTFTVSTVAGIVLGYFGLKRSRKVDKVSEASGVAKDARAGIAQEFEALRVLIDNLQEDRVEDRGKLKDNREELKELKTELNAGLENCSRRIEELIRERDQFKKDAEAYMRERDEYLLELEELKRLK